MDQIKIGKFIAECRKKNNLTQRQLADKLNITDRAISKWERGFSMPDSSLMLDLCSELKISVNDLLCGEVIQNNDYNKKAEQNLLEMQRLKEVSDRRLLRVESAIVSMAVVMYLVLVFVVSFCGLADNIKFLIIMPLTVFVFMVCLLALRIEQQVGYYECQKCHYKYIPLYLQVFMAAHINRTRYMKCPKCHHFSWHEKIISK